MEPMQEVLRSADIDEPSMGVASSSPLDLRSSIDEREWKLGDHPTIAKRRGEDVKNSINKRMDFVVKPMYRAAYALNPRYRTEHFSADVESDLQKVLEIILGDEDSI
jgi:hypothetical protein